MPEGIQNRGPHHYRVQIRRNGVYQSRTFPTLREAREWRSITDGKVSGGEQVNTREARNTTLAQACDWMLEGSRAGTNANAKNIKAKLRYWPLLRANLASNLDKITGFAIICYHN